MQARKNLLRIITILAELCVSIPVWAQTISINDSVRPNKGDKEIPVGTSFYIQVFSPDDKDPIKKEGLKVQLRRGDGKAVEILNEKGEFARGYTGTADETRTSGLASKEAISININGEKPLKAASDYRFVVFANTAKSQAPVKVEWEFRTEEKPGGKVPVAMGLDLKAEPVRWQGAFFTGFCKPAFGSSEYFDQIPSYDLMAQAQKEFKTKAWTNQRDAHTSSFDYRAARLGSTSPNIVRELETRRIKAMERTAEGVRLTVEDFFGHEQYDIPSNRPLSEDYKAGNEVLLADGKSSTRTLIISVDDAAKTVLVNDFDTSASQLKLEYEMALPEKEDPKTPGLFPPGGAYLRKFKPAGTPRYYWGRLDKEYDIVHKKYGRRIHVNIIDAIGDVSADGGSAMIPKDYMEHHETVRAISSHIIERYGEASKDFIWSVFNEPDLMSGYWRSKDWDELQKFYDYTADAMLRAFEDNGYDSNEIMIGGLELGAVFGKSFRIKEFLAHCTPKPVDIKGVVPYNAAYADKRLDGKRSKRADAVAAKGNGKGTPCDFVVVHAYNPSPMAAEKLIYAKEVALEIDPEFYKNLWVNTHESCLTWAGGPDKTDMKSFIETGYFPTWCADVTARLIQKGAEDPRYAFGESIVTIWPWPCANFGGLNGVTRVIDVDDNGDGKSDRKVTVPMQILNFLTLLGTMGDNYWPLPLKQVDRHAVSGFASKTDEDLRVILYSHSPRDMESASDKTFEVSLDLDGVDWKKARIKEYRFDKENNSYYEEAMALGQKKPEKVKLGRKDRKQLRDILKQLESADPATQKQAVQDAMKMGPKASDAFPVMVKAIRSAYEKEEANVMMFLAGGAVGAGKQITYTPKEIRPVEEKSKLHVTRTFSQEADGGHLRLTVPVMANGASFLVVEPE